MKRSFVNSSLVGIYLVAVSVCIGEMRAAHALPGVAVADDALDAVRAAGCGQFGSTQGQSACVGTYACPTDPQTHVCVDSNKSCPDCTGLTHIICYGSDGSDNLCTPYTVVCCTATNKCELTDDVDNPCQCGPPAIGTPIGTRNMVTITYNSGCSGGGGGGTP